MKRPWLTGLVLVVFAFSLSACGSVKTPRGEAASGITGGETQSGPTAPTTWVTESTSEVRDTMRFDKPPVGAAPVHTFLDAFSTCLLPATDMTRSPCGNATGTPKVTLALFSDNTHGEVQPGGSTKLTYQNRLVWWLQWTGQPCPRSGPGPILKTDGTRIERSAPPELNNCILDVVVDATTNEHLLSQVI